MCHICEARGEVGARYRKIQVSIKPLKHSAICHEWGPGGVKRCEAFNQPDRTKKPLSLTQQRRALFKQGPIGKATYCPATLPLFPEPERHTCGRDGWYGARTDIPCGPCQQEASCSVSMEAAW